MEPDRQIKRVPPFLISERLAGMIDDWRFAHRCESRAEAIRRLIEAGLKAEAAAVPNRR
jgi:metal-responsive CopG/Arc/MetJ family transcriptional regulator